ncbi:MAG: Hsp70 family protein [Pseudohongiellaceae bacterium]
MDFGTSNSAAAIFDGSELRLVPLEQHTNIMPSAVYIDKDLKISTGQQAIDSYIKSNMGRKVELSAELLGEARTTTGQIGDRGLPEAAESQKLYGQAFFDAGLQGRLFRGVKRLLGQKNTERLMVFDKPFRLVALVTPILLRIREEVASLVAVAGVDNDFSGNGKRQSRHAHPTADHACLGHPVNFEGREKDHNITALRRLAEAGRYAGFDKQRYCPEPIAAAISYLHGDPQARHDLLLAVDFGGGTLDLCLLKRNQERFDVLATHGIGLGGDRIDQRLFRELLFSQLGKGERWRRKGEDREIETLFPFEKYEDLLLNWAVSYMLNQNVYTAPVMSRIEQGDEAAEKFRRLYELIKNNYSYLVFQAIKEMKATLSNDTEAWLDIPEIDVKIHVTRDTLERCIADVLHDFRESVVTILRQADVSATSVNLVIRTGGSSLIPAVKQILEELFPQRVIEHDPFTSVAAGLAIAEYYQLDSAAGFDAGNASRRWHS